MSLRILTHGPVEVKRGSRWYVLNEAARLRMDLIFHLKLRTSLSIVIPRRISGDILELMITALYSENLLIIANYTILAKSIRSELLKILFRYFRPPIYRAPALPRWPNTHLKLKSASL